MIEDLLYLSLHLISYKKNGVLFFFLHKWKAFTRQTKVGNLVFSHIKLPHTSTLVCSHKFFANFILSSPLFASPDCAKRKSTAYPPLNYCFVAVFCFSG